MSDENVTISTHDAALLCLWATWAAAVEQFGPPMDFEAPGPLLDLYEVVDRLHKAMP